MGIEVLWDNEEKTIIRYDYGKDWSWDDFWTAVETSNAMVRTVSHTVDFIANFEGGTPPPLGAFSKFKRAQEISPPNVGIIAIAGGSSFINALVSTFSRIYKQLGQRLIMTSTLSEAREKLAERQKAAGA